MFLRWNRRFESFPGVGMNGEMVERLNAPVSKTGGRRKLTRGFESLSLRRMARCWNWHTATSQKGRHFVRVGSSPIRVTVISPNCHSQTDNFGRVKKIKALC